MLDRQGLNQGLAGNLSLRQEHGRMLITPSGMAPEALAADDLVALDLQGRGGSDQRRPSSEWRLHARVYQARPDLKALVHTHSPYATALACLERDLPAFHYMVAMAGGEHIPCAAYATFGSMELAQACIAALGDHLRACLMAHHGLLAGGASLEDATQLAVCVEHLAKIYAIARGLGEPGILSPEQMHAVVERLREYGQPVLPG